MREDAAVWAARMEAATGARVQIISSRNIEWGKAASIVEAPDGLYARCPFLRETSLLIGPIAGNADISAIARAKAIIQLWEAASGGDAHRKARQAAHPPSLERELIGRVRIGDHSGAKRMLNQLLARVFLTTSGNLDSIKARSLELLSFLMRAAVEGGTPLGSLWAKEGLGLDALAAKEDFEGVCAFVVRALDIFIEAVYSARNPVSSEHLSKITAYIQAHYQQEISLTEAAAQAPISPYYLSHLFRQELGMTFSEYLTQVRLEEARRLLSDTQMHIRDVALAVGYGDAGYFTRVFRKSAGCTPAKYRQSFRS